MGILSLFQEGGFVMYPLLLCSIIIWAVVFEKFWGIRQFKNEYCSLFEKAKKLLQEGKMEEAKGLYSSADDLVARPHLTLFESYREENQKRDEKIKRRLLESQMGLKRFLWMLGTIASMAPFIGLFGTVVGIIKSFESIAVTGKSGFSVVAQGLSEALIATAAGIIIAVIAVIFYNYFQNVLGRVNLDFKHRLEDLADYLN